GIRYAGVGRWQDAVAPAEEAVHTFRMLAGTNAAFLPDLAEALNSLGIRYAGVGRWQDAVAPAEEAVHTFRMLAGTNAAFLRNLAMALNNLSDWYAEVGRPEAAERVWNLTLADISLPDAAFLLLARSASAKVGDRRVVDWLRTALRLSDGNRQLTAGLREQARRHRAPDPKAFDAAWTGPPSDWLLIDAGLLTVARSWLETSTYLAERDYLAAHSELLAPAADAAVSEVLLNLDEDKAQRYVALRDAARIEGAAAAYKPLLLRVLAHEFVAADVPRQAALLANRRDDLLTETVRTIIHEMSEDGGAASAVCADALLALAADGDVEPVLRAMARPDLFPALLDHFAAQDDAAALGPAAVLAHIVAATAVDAADAAFWIAVAIAIGGDIDEASVALAQARELDPNQASDWITKLARVGQRHPAVLPLIPPLTRPLDDTAGAAQ
ncbi:tetratricopeptide repeat protein, partial [Polymorphospora sp. NPDC050346]|uniref:tetratricopeptide repeat protein n=1 Tax=Polymorphospora sp. NPDC050346 TaxID=3155780 RepID=UPI003407812F